MNFTDLFVGICFGLTLGICFLNWWDMKRWMKCMEQKQKSDFENHIHGS